MNLKKMIAISVVFALVAGAVFAEINVSGGTHGSVRVIEGDSFEETDVYAGGGMGRIRFEGSGENEDGTFGGWMRFEAGSQGGTLAANALAWWKPIQQVKLQIGYNPDGHFAADNIVGWGFYASAGDLGIAGEGWAFGGNSFFGGYGKGGTILTLTPIDLLEVNVGIPFFQGGRAEGIFKQTTAQVALNLEGIGKAAITFVGGYEGDNDSNRDWLQFGPTANRTIWRPDLTLDNDPYSGSASYDSYGEEFRTYARLTRSDKIGLKYDGQAATLANVIKGVQRDSTEPTPTNFGPFNTSPNAPVASPGAFSITVNGGAPKFYASFDLSMIENLGLNFGVGFALPVKDEIVNELDADTFIYDTVTGEPSSYRVTKRGTYNYQYNTPVAIGLGASFETGAIGVKARVQAQFAEKFTLDYDYEDILTPTNNNTDSFEYKGPFVLDFDILPSYAINDSMKVYLSAGLKLTGKATYERMEFVSDTIAPAFADAFTAAQYAAGDVPQYHTSGPLAGQEVTQKVEKEIDSTFGWHVNPYFTKSAGSGTFFAGFRLWSDGNKVVYDRIDKYGTPIDAKVLVNWAVPIGISFGF